MKNIDFMKYGKEMVARYVNSRDTNDLPDVSPDNVYIVGYSRISEKFTGMFAIRHMDGTYYKIMMNDINGRLTDLHFHVCCCGLFENSLLKEIQMN